MELKASSLLFNGVVTCGEVISGVEVVGGFGKEFSYIVKGTVNVLEGAFAISFVDFLGLPKEIFIIPNSFIGRGSLVNYCKSFYRVPVAHANIFDRRFLSLDNYEKVEAFWRSGKYEDDFALSFIQFCNKIYRKSICLRCSLDSSNASVGDVVVVKEPLSCVYKKREGFNSFVFLGEGALLGAVSNDLLYVAPRSRYRYIGDGMYMYGGSDELNDNVFS